MALWFKSRDTTPMTVAPDPEPIAATLGPMPDDDYLRTATEAGLADSAGIILARLRQALSARGLYIYDLESVEDYLDQRFGGSRRSRYSELRWTWQAVTHADAMRNDDRHGRGWTNGCILAAERYQGAVPLPVVETIQALRTAIPELKFLISGESKRMPAGDPFLAVWHPSFADLVVVERWDEPSYRGSDRRPR